MMIFRLYPALRRLAQISSPAATAALFLLNTSARAEELEQTAWNENWFVDTNGTRRDFDAAHRIVNAPSGEAHPWRAALESSLGLGIGTAWYWLDDETNRVDWDNPELRERLNGDAWRFDNNSFAINSIAHPMTGAGFYALGRFNNLGPGWSYVNSFGFSLLWELGIEFKEKFSINDQLVTPLAGISVGEFAYKMGRYLNSVSAPTGFQNALRFGLGLGESYHRAWDGVRTGAPGAVDARGYTTDLWHRFELGYSLGIAETASDTPPLHSYKFSGEFVGMPGYQRVGRAERWFYQLEFSRLDLRMMTSTAGSGFALDSEAILAGHYLHRHEGRGKPGVDGVSHVVGVNVAYAYRSSSARGFDERYAPLSLPGLSAKLWLTEGDLRLEARARANIDFTTMSSLSHPLWVERHPDLRGKTVLRKEGYFYGFGPSTAGAFTASFRNVQAYGSLLAASVHSTEGIDRSQEELQFDERAHSTLLEWEAGARVLFPKTPLVGQMGYRSARWYSWVEGAASTVNVDQVDLGLSLLF